jgi:hypothetical protein
MNRRSISSVLHAQEPCIACPLNITKAPGSQHDIPPAPHGGTQMSVEEKTEEHTEMCVPSHPHPPTRVLDQL